MNACPVCSHELQPIEAAPCFDCGHAPRELDECRQGTHDYYVFNLWERELVLCDFCYADFGSYFPDYWGLPDGSPPDYPLRIIRNVERPVIARDMYCPTCHHRLAFLLFRRDALTRNADESSSGQIP